MDSLDWEYKVTEDFFLRELEKSNIVWFCSWLEKVEQGKTFSSLCTYNTP